MSEVTLYGQTHCMACGKRFRRGHNGIPYRQGTMCASCIVSRMEMWDAVQKFESEFWRVKVNSPDMGIEFWVKKESEDEGPQ